jgi:hypothetical protein
LFTPILFFIQHAAFFRLAYNVISLTDGMKVGWVFLFAYASISQKAGIFFAKLKQNGINLQLQQSLRIFVFPAILKAVKIFAFARTIQLVAMALNISAELQIVFFVFAFYHFHP